MKKYKITIILSIILVLNLSSLFIIINVKGLPVSDISYNFDDNILFNNNSITSYDDSFNLRNFGNYTGLYNASYSFTNELDGISGTDIIFVDEITSGVVSIINTSVNHDKILSYNNTPPVFKDVFNNFSNPHTSGIIEFWLKNNDATNWLQVNIMENALFMILVGIFNDQFYYFDDVSRIDFGTALDNVWYQYKVELFADNTYDFYFNNDLIVSGIDTFDDMVIGSNRFNIRTHTNIIDFDGIGYSWLSNYTIGTNLLPILNESQTLQEIDRFEFAMTGVNTFNQFLDSNVNGWIDIEGGGGSKVQSVDEIDGSFDRLISISSAVAGEARGIKKEDFVITGNLINVSLGIIFMVLTGLNSQFFFQVFDSNNLTLTSFFVRSVDNTLWIIDDSGSVDTGIVIQETLSFRYDFNLLINLELDRVFLVLRENNIVIFTLEYNTQNDNGIGLSGINARLLIIQSELEFVFIDYIGVYSNGISQLPENLGFGVAQINIGSNDWSFENNNLFTITANGFFHLGSVDTVYTDDTTLFTIRSNSTYDNNSLFLNVYNAFISDISNPILLMTVINNLGNLFNITAIKIDGVLLNQTTSISHSLEFEHGSVNTNESFFRVSNNVLIFTHTANDSNLEFIQARFSINPISSTDFSLSFISVIQNNAFGFLRVNFTDISNLVQIPNIRQTSRFILTQNLTINDFIILITDRNDNSITGQTTGSMEIIELLITQNIGTSIITASLVNMMIPIIMILIPTLALSNRYGKNLIIPMFLLMSVICVISTLIPVWLFFIIVISNSVFLLKKKG